MAMKRKLQLPAGPVRESDDAFLWYPVLMAEADGLMALSVKDWVKTEQELEGEDTTTVTVLPSAQKALQPRLSLVSSSTYAVETPVERDTTKAIYSSLKHISFSPGRGVVDFVVDPVACWKAYIDIIGKVRMDPKDTNPIVLDYGSGRILGGFHNTFKLCNTNLASAQDREQRMSVFPIKNVTTAKNLSKQLSDVISLAQGVVQRFFDANSSQTPKPRLSIGELHIVMGFSPAAHFSFHQDECEWTFLVQLSPGESSIRVASFENDAKFDFGGRAFLFPGKAFHRSGFKTRRTMTLTMFMNLDRKAKPSPGKDKILKKEEESKSMVAVGGSSSDNGIPSMTGTLTAAPDTTTDHSETTGDSNDVKTPNDEKEDDMRDVTLFESVVKKEAGAAPHGAEEAVAADDEPQPMAEADDHEGNEEGAGEEAAPSVPSGLSPRPPPSSEPKKSPKPTASSSSKDAKPPAKVRAKRGAGK